MRLYKRGKVWWCAWFSQASGRTERVSTRCTDRAAADAFGRQLERNSTDPDGATAATATIREALDAMIGDYEARAKDKKCADATVEFYRKRAGQLLRMVSVNVLPDRLIDLRPKHIDELIATRRAEGAKPTTISKDLVTFRITLKQAKRAGSWKGDVEAIMPVNYSIEYKPVDRWLSHNELFRLLGEMRTDRAAWVAFAIATGANFSEAAKARAEDVRDDGVHLRGTKRKGRNRIVPIARPWQRWLLDAALSALPEKGPLFAPWTKIHRDLNIAAKKGSVSPLSSNDLRRTFGTWLRADGIAPKDISPMMGHSTSRITEQVYALLDPKALMKLVSGTEDLTPDEASEPVSNLYLTPGRGTDLTDKLDNYRSGEPNICWDFGSDCWTRTSDPVINSHRSGSLIAAEPWDDCADLVPGGPGLIKALARLGIDPAPWLDALGGDS